MTIIGKSFLNRKKNVVGPEGSYKHFENKRLEQCETFLSLYISMVYKSVCSTKSCRQAYLVCLPSNQFNCNG